MSELFTISEEYKARKVAKKRAPLVVSDASPYIYKVYRLITGNIELTEVITGKKYSLTEDFLSNVYCQQGQFYHKIAKYISDDISSNYLASAISNLSFSNKNFDFYKQLYNELASMHVAYRNEDYLKSFIHIYRVLERIAYALPMIYARKSKDFAKTFALLKKFMDAKDKGELGFLKKALQVIYDGDNILNVSFDIDLTNYAPLNLQNLYYDTYTTKLLKNDMLDPSTDQNKIAIKFISVGDAIIITRNQIAHSLSDGEKLLCSDFVEINTFLRTAIKPYFTWISVLFLGIMRDNYDNYNP